LNGGFIRHKIKGSSPFASIFIESSSTEQLKKLLLGDISSAKQQLFNKFLLCSFPCDIAI